MEIVKIELSKFKLVKRYGNNQFTWRYDAIVSIETTITTGRLWYKKNIVTNTIVNLHKKFNKEWYSLDTGATFSCLFNEQLERLVAVYEAMHGTDLQYIKYDERNL